VIVMLAIADEQQRDRARQLVLADLAAELRRAHVEEVVAEDDEVRPLHARLDQALGAGERGHDLHVAAAEDRLLEQQRAARVVDEEDAPVSLPRESCRRDLPQSAYGAFQIVDQHFDVLAVFDLPSPNRIEPMAAASLTPIALSTATVRARRSCTPIPTKARNVSWQDQRLRVDPVES
jgi:hypothetical protein